jgi:hypothetical protein
VKRRGNFYPIVYLLRNVAFLSSFAASAIAVAGIVVGVWSFLKSQRILIHPVARVSFVEPPTTPGTQVSPMSAISTPANLNKDSILQGWILSLDDLCKAEHPISPRNSVVLVKKSNEITAATAKFGSRTCALSGDLGKGEKIFVTSDVPFPGIDSEKKYVSVDSKR